MKVGSRPLDELIADCLYLLEEEGPQAIERVCVQYPQYADSIRKRVQLLSDLDFLNNKLPEPTHLGEFRLIHPLGKGGMGIVYLAMQESLNRPVALKLIRSGNHHFPENRKRFQREVLTVSGLYHPGITPIYSVGEEDGIPYYAMEYVRGCNLSEVLDSLEECNPSSLRGSDFQQAVISLTKRNTSCIPEDLRSRDDLVTEAIPFFQGTWLEVCLRIVREVAEALSHAHARGIRHRDVKPSNVMVTTAGRVLLLDFGLAIREQDQARTQTGFQPGSLPYMSPEQLREDARRIDKRSDIYSLGVTLFELLTLRSPFREGRHSIQDSELIRKKILSGEHRRLRNWNHALGGEIETVCMTAMEPDPRRRYNTAAELARDITNLLEGRPIQAIPASRFLRGRRWVQRQPATVSAIVLAFLLVVGVPALFAWQKSLSNQELKKLNSKLTIANKERDGLTAQLALELQKANRLRQVADLQEQDARRDAESSRQIFQAIVDFLRNADSDHGLELTAEGLFHGAEGWLEFRFDERSRVKLRMQSVLGEVLQNIGLHKRALAFLQGAVSGYEQLENGGKDKLQVQLVLADTLSTLSEYQVHQYSEAESLYREILDKASSPTSQSEKIYVKALLGLAELYSSRFEYQKSGTHVQEAISVLEHSSEKDSDLWIRAYTTQTVLLIYDDHLDLALQSLGEVGRIIENHYGPDNWRMAHVFHKQAFIRLRQGNTEGVMEQLTKAIDLGTEWLGESSAIVQAARMTRIQALYAKTETMEAEAETKNVLEYYRNKFPDGSTSEAQLYKNLGGILLQRQAFAQARSYLQQALDLYAKLSLEISPSIADVLIMQAFVELQLRNPQTAHSILERAQVILDKSPQPIALLHHRLNTNKFHILAAEGRYEEADKLGQLILEESKRQTGELSGRTAFLMNALAMVQIHLNQHEKATELFRKSLEIFDAVIHEPHASVFESKTNFAMALYFMSQFSESERRYEEALTEGLGLNWAHPTVGHCYEMLIQFARSRGEQDRVLQLMHKRLAHTQRLLPKRDDEYSYGLYLIGEEYIQSQPAKALDYYEQSIEVAEAAHPPASLELAHGRFGKALALQRLGHSEQAEKLMMEVYPELAAQIQERLPPGHFYFQQIELKMHQFFESLGKPEIPAILQADEP